MSDPNTDPNIDPNDEPAPLSAIQYLQRNARWFPPDFQRLLEDQELLNACVPLDLGSREPVRGLEWAPGFDPRERFLGGKKDGKMFQKGKENVLALLIYLMGEPMEQEYTVGHHHKNPFRQKIVPPAGYEQYFAGACANCYYQGNRSRCDRSYLRAPDLRLPIISHLTGIGAPASGLRSARKSRAIKLDDKATPKSQNKTTRKKKEGGEASIMNQTVNSEDDIPARPRSKRPLSESSRTDDDTKTKARRWGPTPLQILQAQQASESVLSQPSEPVKSPSISPSVSSSSSTSRSPPRDTPSQASAPHPEAEALMIGPSPLVASGALLHASEQAMG